MNSSSSANATIDSNRWTTSEDVLTTGQVGVKAGPQVEKRANPASGLDPALVRPPNAADEPQQRRLARPIRPNDPERLPGRDAETYVAQRPVVLDRSQATEPSR